MSIAAVYSLAMSMNYNIMPSVATANPCLGSEGAYKLAVHAVVDGEDPTFALLDIDLNPDEVEGMLGLPDRLPDPDQVLEFLRTEVRPAGRATLLEDGTIATMSLLRACTRERHKRGVRTHGPDPRFEVVDRAMYIPAETRAQWTPTHRNQSLPKLNRQGIGSVVAPLPVDDMYAGGGLVRQRPLVAAPITAAEARQTIAWRAAPVGSSPDTASATYVLQHMRHDSHLLMRPFERVHRPI